MHTQHSVHTCLTQQGRSGVVCVSIQYPSSFR